MMGTSFGAVLMKKYLYEDNEVVTGISVSSPWSLRKTLDFWTSTSYLTNYFYDRNFVNHYKNIILKNIELFKKFEEYNPKFKVEEMLQCNNISQINTYQSIYNGFDSVNDYLYHCKAKVRKVKKPILFIHSKDDPICSFKNMPIHKIKEPHQVYLTEYGGHVSYFKNIDIMCLEWYKKFL